MSVPSASAALGTHPAVVAWRTLGVEPREPSAIEVLKPKGRTTAVYRLLLPTPKPAVVAKRCRRETAGVEQLVYERILRSPGLRGPRYYGCVEEPGSGFCWLFLGEVTGEPYRAQLRSHRVAAARWLALLHTSADPDVAACLPARGPDHYRGLLRAATGDVRAKLRGSGLEARAERTLGASLAHCERLASGWSELEAVCRDMPETLVHGDFVRHNVYVQAAAGAAGAELRLTPIDWEKAGWGTPAEDISNVDVATYWRALRDHCPGLPLDAFERLAMVGRLFRCLVFLEWALPELERLASAAALANLERCSDWLEVWVPRALRGATPRA